MVGEGVVLVVVRSVDITMAILVKEVIGEGSDEDDDDDANGGGDALAVLETSISVHSHCAF